MLEIIEEKDHMRLYTKFLLIVSSLLFTENPAAELSDPAGVIGTVCSFAEGTVSIVVSRGSLEKGITGLCKWVQGQGVLIPCTTCHRKQWGIRKSDDLIKRHLNQRQGRS